MKTAAEMDDAGERIQFLSGQFLGTGYAESTLIGDPNTREILVINLQEVDCMTFIECMEAMRLSLSFPEFIAKLKRVRYKSGVVDYYARNHFFTDWKEFNADFIEDVTERLAGKRTVCIYKKLNQKEDGTSFLKGIHPVMRQITYIPSKDIDQEVIDNLTAGDYIGIFSDLPGLDVSHTGIIVRHNGIVYFRHASSQPQYRQVTDQDFEMYIAGKPGIVVFRPKI
jgi:N-acetylmuramoyl-L-alanine amidase-like